MARPDSWSIPPGNTVMPAEGGLVCAYLLDGRGGGREIGWPEIRTWRAEEGLLWMHLDRAEAEAKRWLGRDSGLDPMVVRTLLAEDVRPRALRIDDGLLVTLRGVNLNPGADPEDMVAVRIWLEPLRIVTVRHRRLVRGASNILGNPPLSATILPSFHQPSNLPDAR